MYNLNDSQVELYFSHKLSDAPNMYNLIGYTTIYTSVHIPSFKKAISYLLKEHPILSMCVSENNTNLKLINTNAFELVYIDQSTESCSDQSQFIAQLKETEKLYRFNVNKEALFRTFLVKLNDNSFIWLFNIHHLISDGWSVSLLYNTVNEYYTKIERDEEISISPNYIFTEYEAFESSYRSSEKYTKDKEYWESQINSEYGYMLSRLTDGNEKGNSACRKTHIIPLHLSSKILLYCSENKLSINDFFVTLYSLFLSKTMDTKEVIIGTSVLNRPQKKFKSSIGKYVSFIPLCFKIEENDNFKAMFDASQSVLKRAFRHQRFPVSSIYRKLNVKENEYCPFMFNFQSSKHKSIFNENPVDQEWLFSGYDEHVLTLNVNHFNGDEITLNFDFNTHSFSSDKMNDIISIYLNLITDCVTDPDIEYSKIKLKPNHNTKTRDTYDLKSIETLDHVSVHMETWIERYKDQIAIRMGKHSLSYLELYKKVKKYASFLEELGVNKGDTICVHTASSPETIAFIFALYNIGAIYVPVDPSQPLERVRYILEDSNSKFILTQNKNEFPCKKILFSDMESHDGIQTHNKVLLDINSIAYIIYTSGTTGTPKGVVNSHRALSHYVDYFSNYFKLSSEDRVVQQASLGFDTSLEEIFPILLIGGSLHIVSKECLLHEDEFHTKLNEEKITVLSTSPAIISRMNEARFMSKDLRILISGGDELRASDIEYLNEKTEIYNTYGPTETTVCALYKKVDTTVTLGTPLRNTNVYILDSHLNKLPNGITGEICISGVGVSEGYLNKETETAKSFVKNPYSINNYDQVIYKTGDLGRKTSNGEIEFHGRKDSQISLNGFRIEPGEIESVASGCDGVETAVVLCKEQHNVMYIVCFYSGTISKDKLKLYLEERLPSYMVPSFFEVLEKFQLTINGKIDRKYLQHLPLNREEKKTEKLSETESEIAEIWGKCLSLDTVYKTDRFFEIGGHSLLANKMMTLVNDKFNVNLSIKDVFTHTALDELSAVVDTMAVNEITDLPIAPKKDKYRLSASQKRLWVLNEVNGANSVYNIPIAFNLKTSIELSVIQDAFKHIALAHDALRTQIHSENGEAYQVIHSDVRLNWNEVNFKEIQPTYSTIESFFAEKSAENISLYSDCLWNIHVVRQDGYYSILLVFHHMITDAWSIDQMVTELKAYCLNRTLPKKPKYRYVDYSEWQYSLEKSSLFNEQETFWKKTLDGGECLVNLHPINPRPNEFSYKGKLKSFKLPKQLINQINTKLDNGFTTNMFYLTAFFVLIKRYTQSDRICIGTPVSGRTHSQLMDIHGFFVNTVLLNKTISTKENFRSLLQQIKETLLSAYEHELIPFDVLLERLQLESDQSYSAPFNLFFSWQKRDELNKLKDTFAIEKIDLEQGISLFDLSMLVEESTNETYVKIEYCTDLYTDPYIEELYDSYLKIIQFALNDENKSIDSYCLNSDVMLPAFKPENDTFIDSFQKNCAIYPDRIAVSFNNIKQTYTELNQLSEYYAVLFRESYGVQKNDNVLLFVDKSEHYIAIIIGLLKLGAAYVPIDSKQPESRVRYLYNDCNATLLICESEEIRFSDLKTYSVKEISNQNYFNTFTNESDINGLAYIIYTSGSTGNPKGVMVGNDNLSSVLIAEQSLYNLNESFSSIQITNYCFDVSILEIFLPLFLGGKIVVPDPDEIHNHQYLVELINTNKVSDLQTTPSYFLSFLNQLENTSALKLNATLKRICIGGESLTESIVETCVKILPNVELNNHYGPTEITVDALVLPNVKTFNKNSIGYALSNAAVAIVDSDLNDLPNGAVGQIAILGNGVTKGYLNDPEKTNAVFVKHKTKHVPMYLTGDLGRILPDKSVELIGREDDQIKIRGYRVELGEVKNALLKLAFVNDAYVLYLPENKQLIAYLLTDLVKADNELKELLSSKLPHYMIPHRFITMDKFPLTVNGKVDKKQLPKPEIRTDEILKPTTQTEKELYSIWQRVLKLGSLSITDNFFELGGHSLHIMELISSVYKQLSKTLRVSDIYTYPTIGTLSDYINSLDDEVYQKISELPKQEYYECSHAQKRMWALSVYDKNSSAYNMPGFFKVSGEFNPTAIEAAYNNVIDSHEILRTNFIQVEKDVVQKVQPIGKKSFELINKMDKSIASYIDDEVNRVFNLEQDSLVQLKVIHMNDNEWFIAFNMHHIISDGVTMNLFINELFKRYYLCIEEKEYTSDKSDDIQYKEFAAWQNNELKKESFLNSEDYWRTQFKDGYTPISLPLDQLEHQKEEHSGASFEISFGTEISDKIKFLKQNKNYTEFNIFYSALCLVMQWYTKSENMCIGTPVSGRTHPITEDLMGLFVNTVALKSKIGPKDTYSSVMKFHESMMKDVLDHQIYPYDLFVEKIMLGNNAFDMMFSYQEIDSMPVSSDMKVEAYKAPKYTSKFNMSILITRENGEYKMLTEYKTNLYSSGTIELFSERLKEFLLYSLDHIDNPTDALYDFLNTLFIQEEETELEFSFNF